MTSIIVLEYLSSLAALVMEKCKLDLYVMGESHVESHLMFADVVVFFSHVSTKSVKVIKGILQQFTAFFSLEVNNDKCYVIFSASVTDHLQLAAELGFLIKHLLINHLGAPLTRCSIQHKTANT